MRNVTSMTFLLHYFHFVCCSYVFTHLNIWLKDQSKNKFIYSFIMHNTLTLLRINFLPENSSIWSHQLMSLIKQSSLIVGKMYAVNYFSITLVLKWCLFIFCLKYICYYYSNILSQDIQIDLIFKFCYTRYS